MTGISTGAIIAVFAFLGPEYDDDLRQMYTSYKTSDLFTRTIFAALTGGSAVLDASGYRSLLEYYIDDGVVARLAEAYRDGRMLLIGTTNIDASRPVIWNIGAIAASGAPYSKKLIHDVIQASSAIPAAFPPVLIPVEANGRTYDEMHVDGGATVMLYSPGISPNNPPSHRRRIRPALLPEQAAVPRPPGLPRRSGDRGRAAPPC
ncbi:MAG: patatin-like phospholipase family protein [bacterium]